MLARRALDPQQAFPIAYPRLQQVVSRFPIAIGFWRCLPRARIVLAGFVEGNSAMRIHMSVGQRLPMLMGAVGRAIAAKLDQSEQELHAAFTPLKWQTPVMFEDYVADVDEARLQGYAVDRGTFASGVTSVAVAIGPPGGPIGYGVSGIMFASAETDGLIDEIGAELMDVADWAAEMPDEVADAGIDAVRRWGYDRALSDQREVLDAFHVHFDVWSSEQALVDSGAMDAALADLRERGHAYDADGATWLRSTDFGDDKDRPLLKSDGDPTYLLPDIAYHRDKFARGFDLLIDVWGADHHGYVPRMRAGIEALGHDPDEFEVPIVQIVRLEREGKEVRLSKRAGDIIELRDLIDEVGADVARLTYLLQSVDSQQTIDLDLVTSRSNDNPVFYVQYAHARIHSIMVKAAEAGIARVPLGDADLALLTHEREIELLRTLSELPETLARAARERAPHTVTNWVRELADRFHGFYHDCYVIGDVPAELTQARLWLVESARIGFAIGLDLLGVSAPESM
jgi:DNA-binding IclR family transcriptional regulator